MRRRTRSVAVAAVAALAPAPRALAAQATAPEFVVAFSGGHTASRPVWGLRQPVVVPVPGPLLIDTFLLTRGLAAGWSAWAGITWYPGRNTGFGAEVGWVSAQVESGCAIAGTPQPDPGQQNAVTCERITHDREATSAVAIVGAATLRAAPHRAVSPYVRAGVGFALLGGSFAMVRSHLTTETCRGCVRVILDGSLRPVTWAATVAAGLSVGGISEYRLRAEVRDFVLGIPVVTGPADPLAESPVPRTRTQGAHRFTVALGLDVVLNGRHRRRY